MTQFEKNNTAVFLAFILAVCFTVSGCAPLLVGAGAVGGYEMATHNDSHK